jgi:hypothetical protein
VFHDLCSPNTSFFSHAEAGVMSVREKNVPLHLFCPSKILQRHKPVQIIAIPALRPLPVALLGMGTRILETGLLPSQKPAKSNS